MCWVQCSEYLIQWDIVNRRPVNLKDPISNMNGVFHIWTDAVRVHPEWNRTISRKNYKEVFEYLSAHSEKFCLDTDLRSDKVSAHLNNSDSDFLFFPFYYTF